MPVPPSTNRPGQSLFYDRVREVTTTSGTGTVTLGGSPTGYQTFAAVGDGNWCYYCIADQNGPNWEVGIGQYTLSGTTLSRVGILASSNSGSLVSFGGNTKDVFLTWPATTAMGTLYTATATATVVSTITETTLTPSYAVGSLTLPANVLIPGKAIHVNARGYFSTKASSPGTLTLKWKAGSVVLASTGAISVTAGLSNVYWEFDADAVTYSVGATGTLQSQGRAILNSAITGIANMGTSTVDTTVAETVSLTATWSVSDGTNSITLTNLTLSSRN